MNGVLEGIRVLDFGRYIAGPFCATMLADMGAEVIRIERVEGSEDRYIAPVGEHGEGCTFLQMARNKMGITLNPSVAEGKTLLKALVKTADVVIANLPTPTLERMGIDYESLKAIKEDVILVHISAFGSKGPYHKRVGFDLIGQAMSGMSYISGSDASPIRSQAPYVDYSTALFAAFGCMSALMERQRSGKGQVVEASLLASSIALNNGFIIEEGVLQNSRLPHGNKGHHHAPNDIFKTKDGHIVTMVVGDPLFKRWAKLMGEDAWLSDPRFATDKDRGQNSEVVSERMQTWCAERNTDEAIEALATAQIPAGPVYTPRQVLEDEHVQDQQLLKQVDYPGLPHAAPLANTPVRLSRTPGGIRQRPPTLGEHTQGVLESLGYDAQQIDKLRQAGAI